MDDQARPAIGRNEGWRKARKGATAANISRAEKKRKSRVVCRTHGVGSAHHARSDGVPVFVPVVPQGLQIVLTDASTQTDLDKNNSPRRLTRASSVPLF
ncbi:hypothetical protein Tco_1225144 [Tanacetum coccineum]